MRRTGVRINRSSPCISARRGLDGSGFGSQPGSPRVPALLHTWRRPRPLEAQISQKLRETSCPGQTLSVKEEKDVKKRMWRETVIQKRQRQTSSASLFCQVLIPRFIKNSHGLQTVLITHHCPASDHLFAWSAAPTKGTICT
uniref:Uncharacterized protein n=1 Tax=Molossus molossus TaxID=27622 RepID=A0A7J8DCD8_MOLMO|nr:hypothetical protein HJG59_009337 [Molossus molossus]